MAMNRRPRIAADRRRGVSPAARRGGATFNRAGGSAAHARGFTLLEAIVALVIFSLGAFALYGWLSSNLYTLGRVEARREAVAVARSALDMMRRVNPMETPTGSRRVDALEVAWTSTPLQPPRDGRSQVGLPTAFQVGLYVVDVRVRLDDREVERFELRLLGHKQVRSLDFD